MTPQQDCPKCEGTGQDQYGFDCIFCDGTGVDQSEPDWDDVRDKRNEDK